MEKKKMGKKHKVNNVHSVSIIRFLLLTCPGMVRHLLRQLLFSYV